jgi:hypothetical protein
MSHKGQQELMMMMMMMKKSLVPGTEPQFHD